MIRFHALSWELTSRAILSSLEKTTLSTDKMAASLFLTHDTCKQTLCRIKISLTQPLLLTPPLTRVGTWVIGDGSKGYKCLILILVYIMTCSLKKRDMPNKYFFEVKLFLRNQHFY